LFDQAVAEIGYDANTLAMRVRRKEATLFQSLARLDQRIDKAPAEDIFTDEIKFSPPRSKIL
jgi:hypothetical protein